MTVIHGWLSRFQGELQEEKADFLALGPISLFATLCIALQKGGNFDLAIAGAAGIFLSLTLRMRGLFYSLVLLFLGAAVKHFLFLESHFWQIGIEASMALGLIICALSAELLYSKEAMIEAKIESRDSALRNLEEEAGRRGLEALEEKIALQSRLSDLQKELDEKERDLASLRILSDVVRKSCLKKEEEGAKIAEKERRIAELLQEIEVLSSQQPSLEALQNAQLLQELNHARVEKEQTCLINETLVRLHGAADRKAREMALQNEMLQERIEVLCKAQSERDELAKAELQEMRFQMDHLMQQGTAAAESERRQWKERLSEQDKMIALFQERISALTETQALYFQLKKQFEEKNRVLHETRQELFRAETALQAAQIDQRWEEVEFPLFESMLVSEVVLLEEEKRGLESENAELSQIIGMLSHPL